MTVLDGLDRVAWDTLGHAYGAASDVPALLRSLAEEQNVDDAIHALWGNVFHQGTRYPASPAVVPFLYEILRGEPSTTTASFLLRYLHGLALGFPGDLFPRRPDPDAWVASFEGFGDEEAFALHATSGGTMEELDARTRKLGAYWATRTYVAVEAGLDDALPWIASSDESRAVEALALVSSFPRRADVTGPRVREALADPRPVVRGAALLALALLGEATPSALDAVAREPDPAEEDPEAARILRFHAAAALALGPDGARAGDDVLAVLTAPLDDIADYHSPFANSYAAMVSAALLRLAEAHPSAVVHALARQHDGADGLACLQLSRDLLCVAFPERPPERAADLGELQRVALDAVLRSRGWEWGNYSFLMRRFGLPATRQALEAWLGA